MQCKACGAEMVKGRLVSTYCSHFVLDDGTVEYGGKEVESFPVKQTAFGREWWKAVTQYHTIALPARSLSFLLTERAHDYKTSNSKSPLLVQRALLCIVIQMRSLTLAFLPTRSRR